MAEPRTIATQATDQAVEHDQDAPYERVDEDRAAISPPSTTPVPPRGYRCNVGQHRKSKPATSAYELSVIDGQRVLVTPYVLAACADHGRELHRIVRSRSERLARGGLEARAEVLG